MSESLFELNNKAAVRLSAANIDNAQFEAFQMLLTSEKITSSYYYLNKDNAAKAETAGKLKMMTDMRISGEPLQYILGEWDFLSDSFAVGRGVLIPRPETEQLAIMCIDEIRKNNYRTVFDLCAGTGCIGLSIAKACPETHVYEFELYDEAIGYIKTNIKRLKVSNAEIVNLDIFSGKPDFLPVADLLVSNPPYIPSGEIEGLQKEVSAEPVTALDGGGDGLDFYKCISKLWLKELASGGYVAVECGEGQSDIIRNMFSEFCNASVSDDLYSVPRFVHGHVF